MDAAALSGRLCTDEASMAISAINFDVVESLQNQLAQASPGSQREQVLEKALDYALSPERKPTSSAFLLHDVIRDARKAVYRTGVLAQRFHHQLDNVVSRGGAARRLRPDRPRLA
jgi:hypothetical protein